MKIYGADLALTVTVFPEDNNRVKTTIDITPLLIRDESRSQFTLSEIALLQTIARQRGFDLGR